MTQVQNDITSLLSSATTFRPDTGRLQRPQSGLHRLGGLERHRTRFTILLGAVAGISLVVGGIGIMNMMLTTVTERTREIGLRKAIGAKRHDINIQFLIEAVALTVIGGLIGVILGWAISYRTDLSSSVLPDMISLSSILLAFGVSAAIGIVFGYYPADALHRLIRSKRSVTSDSG